MSVVHSCPMPHLQSTRQTATGHALDGCKAIAQATSLSTMMRASSILRLGIVLDSRRRTPMSRDAFRFAVGEPGGVRSVVWRAWHSGSDVYVATRGLGGVLKASLHRAGDYYAGFTSEYAPEARARGMLAPGKSRQTLSWVGRPLNEDLTFLMRMLIPGSQLVTLGDPRLSSKRTEWIPSPPAGQDTEVSVFIGRPGILFPQWPGTRSMQTHPVGRFILPSGSFCHVVWRHTNELTSWAEEQIAEIRGGARSSLGEPGLGTFGSLSGRTPTVGR